jgi:hypothetical protein
MPEPKTLSETPLAPAALSASEVTVELLDHRDVVERADARKHQRGVDGDPRRGDGADDHGADHDDGGAQRVGLRSDERLDGGAAELVALVEGDTSCRST